MSQQQQTIDEAIHKQLQLRNRNDRHKGQIQSTQSIEQIAEKGTGVIEKVILMNVNLSHIGTKYLSQTSTPNLKFLFLNNNKIGNKGCKYITKAQWNKLQFLCLNQNEIDSEGVSHLCKGNWSQLMAMELLGNHLGHNSLKMLVKANFPKITDLFLSNKFIRAQVQSTNHQITCNQLKNLFFIECIKLRHIFVNEDIHGCDAQLVSLQNLLKKKFLFESIYFR